MPQAQFSIHIPKNHAMGNDLPELIDSVRDALTAAGIHGRRVHDVQSDLGDSRHAMFVVQFEAEDDPMTRHLVQTIGTGIKSLSGHPGVYVTVQPLETWLI